MKIKFKPKSGITIKLKFKDTAPETVEQNGNEVMLNEVAPASVDPTRDAPDVLPASPGKDMAQQHATGGVPNVSNDRTDKFDLLKLPRELRDMIFLCWLDITDPAEEETATTDQGDEFLHECRGFYVPFRSYLRRHEDSSKNSLEVVPSPCELFSAFGSQIRHEAMQFIFRDHVLLDLKAKHCLQAFAKWVEAFPLDALAIIENLQLLVSCRALATGDFADVVQRTASEVAFDFAKHDNLKWNGQKDIELDFCFEPDTALFHLKLSRDLKEINVFAFEQLDMRSRTSLATSRTSFGNGLLFESHFTGLDLLSVAEVIKWSEALRRTSQGLDAVKRMTKTQDCEAVADWCPWYIMATDENTRMVTEEEDDDGDFVSYELVRKEDRSGRPLSYPVMIMRLDPCIKYPPLTLEDLKTAHRRLVLHLRGTAYRWEESFP